MKPSIILTGLSGSGKSSVGKALSEVLQCPFIDTDIIIEQQYGQSVTEIFQLRGEPFFRDAETETLHKLTGEAKSKPDFQAVISTGGGLILREENRKLIKQLGKVVFLSASIEQLSSRLANDITRPLLSTAENQEDDKIKKKSSQALQAKLSNLWKERKDAYLQADITIETGDQSPVEVAKKICSLLDFNPPICKIQSEC